MPSTSHSKQHADPDIVRFVEQMRKVKADWGWTSEELADRCGLTRQGVTKWFGRKPGLPETPTLLRLSSATGRSVDWLLGLPEARPLVSEKSPASRQEDPARRSKASTAGDRRKNAALRRGLWDYLMDRLESDAAQFHWRTRTEALGGMLEEVLEAAYGPVRCQALYLQRWRERRAGGLRGG